MSLKRLSMLVLLLALALLLSGVFAYIASPKIAGGMASRYLANSGASNVHIDIERAGLQGVFINRLEVRWQGFDVDLQSIDIFYTIGGLLNGQIDAVSIDLVTAITTSDKQTFSPALEEKTWKFEVPAALFTWRELLTDALPGRIEISEIRLRDSTNELRSSLLYSENILSMQGDVHFQPLITGHSYALTIDQNRKLEITLFQDKTQTEALVSFQSSNGTGNNSIVDPMTLSGKLSTSAAFLLEALQPYLQDLGIQEITGALTLTLQLQAPWQESGSIALEDIQISGSITPDIKASLRVPEFENHSALVNWSDFSTVSVSPEQFEISPGPYISVSGPDLEAELGIATLHGDLINFTRLSSVALSILPGANLRLQNLVDQNDIGVSLPHLTLTLNTPLNITVNQETQSVGVQAAVLGLEIPRLIYQQHSYILQPFIINTPELYTVPDGPLDLTINIRNLTNTLTANIDITTNNEVVTSKSRLNLDSKDSLFGELFSNWNQNFDANGSLGISLIATLGIDPLEFSSLSGELILKNSNLFLDELNANNVALNVPFRFQNTQFATDWARVKADQVNVGIEISNIEGRLRYSPSTLSIGAFKMLLLGGEAHSKALDYTFGSPAAHTQISFSNLQLPRLVALANDDVKASGRIDGSIQLSGLFGKDGSLDLVIDEGSLSARSPGGLIQYRIGGQSLGLAKQSDVDFALTALENFNYHRLDSTVSLNQDGQLKLGVSLSGSNPQVKNGRQIQYNLNIDQNLFTLLRSLQLSNKLSDRIGEKLAD